MLNGSRLYYKTIKCEKILPIQLQRTTPPSGAPNDSFLLNTLKTLFIQSAFRCLERYSERRYKICICSVILGELESFRNY